MASSPAIREKSGLGRGGTPPPKEFQFKPGQSGNPSGRPKRLPLTDRYAVILEQEAPEDIRKKFKLKKGATWGDVAVLSTMREAIKSGDVATLKEIADRIEGKPRQRVEMQLSGSVDLYEIIAEARKRAGDEMEETPTKKVRGKK